MINQVVPAVDSQDEVLPLRSTAPAASRYSTWMYRMYTGIWVKIFPKNYLLMWSLRKNELVTKFSTSTSKIIWKNSLWFKDE